MKIILEWSIWCRSTQCSGLWFKMWIICLLVKAFIKKSNLQFLLKTGRHGNDSNRHSHRASDTVAAPLKEKNALAPGRILAARFCDTPHLGRQWSGARRQGNARVTSVQSRTHIAHDPLPATKIPPGQTFKCLFSYYCEILCFNKRRKSELFLESTAKYKTRRNYMWINFHWIIAVSILFKWHVMTKENPRVSHLFNPIIILLSNHFYSKAQEETNFTRRYQQKVSGSVFNTPIITLPGGSVPPWKNFSVPLTIRMIL